MMARVGIWKTKREFLQLYLGFSRFRRAVDDEAVQSFTREKNSKEDSLTWVPHPRSGIYFPEGHESVMEDVPKGAASLSGRNFWLRNDEGVEYSDTEEVGGPNTRELK